MIERQSVAGAGAARKPDSMMDQLMKAFRSGGKGLQGAALAGVRIVLPLFEAYAARMRDGHDGDEKPGTIGLTRGEEAVLKAAAQKAFLEMVEIASRTHPVYKDAPVFVAFDAEGRTQTPHLWHLLALAAALREFVEGDDGKGEPDGTPPAPSIPPSQTVVFMAVGPGEFALHSGPLTPTEIRRNAMRLRSYNPPQAAVLRSAPSARALVIGPATEITTSTKSGARRLTSASRAGTGCACGKTGGCGCACGGSACGRQFSPARYDEDGRCESVFDISCETRWRVRECFKVAFCDLLRCLGDELCEDGQFQTTPKPDLEKCLETFVCSIVTCLPDAICPPKKPCCEASCEPVCEPACPPRLPAPCNCNYAVGE